MNDERVKKYEKREYFSFLMRGSRKKGMKRGWGQRGREGYE